MPKLFNIDLFCENLPEITTHEIFQKNKFHKEGLFSEQIFGPIKKFTCSCGITYGMSQKGFECPHCKVQALDTRVRRERFAKIKLSLPVINPIFYDLLCYVGGKHTKSLLDFVMRNENAIIYKRQNTESYKIAENRSEVPTGSKIYIRTEGLKEVIREMAIKNQSVSKWKKVLDNIDCMTCSNVIVLPADLRPIGKSATRNVHNTDEINRIYTSIINKNELIKKIILNIMRDNKIYFHHYRQLQKEVNNLYDHIQAKLAKKKGLIRGNILGKRIDFSGRAVIVPDPTLNLDECKLPYVMVLELYKLVIARKLIEASRFKLINEAITFIDRCIEVNHKCLYSLCEEVIEGEYCLLNRQPTLHRLGIQGFKIKLTDGHVIKIHPLICDPYNADFDGDQMAVYIPLTKETKQEIIDKFLVTKNLSNPTDTSLSTKPNQDIVLGIYLLTGGKINGYDELVKHNDGEYSKGLVLFNSVLPKDFRFIDYQVGSKELIQILTEIKNNYSEEEIRRVLDEVKKLGFKFSTSFGVTMSLDKMMIPNKNEIINEIFSDSKKPVEMLQSFADDKIKKILKKAFTYSYIVDSGARGSWDQVKQVVMARGFVSDFRGNIHLEPIKHSLLDGLTPREFFLSSYGCRKGLLDVAVNTGESGYLSRKLIFTCVNLTLGKEEDCGSTDYLEVDVDNERIAQCLLFRYYLGEDKELHEITPENYESLIGSKIKIRSPIYCLGETLCRKCYGNLYKYVNSKYVGIIAAQSLGECNTQLVLRTFHTSGVAKVGKEQKKMIQCDIIGDLSQISSLLHKFPEGTNCENLTRNLFDLYNMNRKIHLVHFECVVSQLMWYGDEKWRLVENRSRKAPQFKSVLNVPSQESWILGFAFNRPKFHMVRGLFNEGKYTGVLDRIMGGERIGDDDKSDKSLLQT